MKKICDIVRDLLPLYAENMTSPASNELVEAHLTQCESCANYLKDLRSPQMLPQEIPVQNLKHIQKMISRRRILSVLTAVFLLLSVITWGKVFLDADVYVSADQAVHSVESLEGGGIRIHWNYRSRGYSTTTYPEDRRNWGILVTQRRRELLFPEHLRTDETQDESGYSDVFGAGRSGAGPIRNEALSPEDNYFYVDYKTGRVEKLLWGGGAEMPPEDYKFWPDLNHGQGWLCGVSGVLSVILFIAAWKKRESRAGKKLRYGALSCAALSLAVLACGGGQLVRALYWLDLVELGAVAAPIFLSGFFAFEIWDLNHPVTVRDESKAARKWQRITLKVLTAVLLILSLAMGIFSFLRGATVNLTAQEAVIGVETLENGDIQIVYSDLVCSTGGIRSDDFDGLYTRGWAGEVYAHRLGFKDSMDRKEGGACPHYTSAQLDVSPSIWYMGPDGTAETLLWDGGTEAPEGALVERDYALGIYCLGTALACVLLAFIGKKFPWAGKYLRCAALAAGSLSLAGVCISGGQFYVLGSGRTELHYTVRNSFFTAIPMFLTGLCAMKLRDLRRQM